MIFLSPYLEGDRRDKQEHDEQAANANAYQNEEALGGVVSQAVYTLRLVIVGSLLVELVQHFDIVLKDKEDLFLQLDCLVLVSLGY